MMNDEFGHWSLAKRAVEARKRFSGLTSHPLVDKVRLGL
jgi:hypothetical protein